MRHPLCPTCHKRYVYRSRRRGLIEHVASLLYVYPFRCQVCTHRFLAFLRGVRFDEHQIERRDYIRIPLRYTATFLGEMTGRTVNLSVQGCALDTETFPPKDGVLRLSLHPLHQSKDLPDIQVEAAVARSVEESLHLIGLEFVGLTSADRQRLQQIVEKYLHDHPEQLRLPLSI